jgi:uncharacterized protein YdeI (YjbR/CyaY-like superfamily)
MLRTTTTKKRKPTTTRRRQTMPASIREALSKHGLLAAYRERPPYQRNDYIIWIMQAKREQTREKRLAQMLSELERGGVYMKMKWRDAPG